MDRDGGTNNYDELKKKKRGKYCGLKNLQTIQNRNT